MKNLFLIIALLFSITLNASNNDNCHSHNCSFDIGSESINLEDIFFTNESEDLIFIDFESISFHIHEIKIIQDGKEILIEDVFDLDQSMIYEIDLMLLKPGDYYIEVLIEDNTKIRKPITVK